MKKQIQSVIWLLVLSILSSGCAVKPWVKNYERNNLAKPEMSFGRDPIAAQFINHVYESREAARGAASGGGGGCGCN